RNFPSRSGFYITIEAKFDGEILTTDPVEHSTVPDVNQELAWELDKKTLQHHKLQRNVIKCNTFATTNDVKENIGYFIIDVRSVNNNQKIQSYHLLQTKYPNSKPEFRICSYVEDDYQKTSSKSLSKIAQSPSKASPLGTTSSSSLLSKSKLQPVLVEEHGYYLLGPDIPQAEIFSLAITINFATNLIHLVPPQYNLSTTDGFFFYYNLFGNDITSETFYDLLNPKFYPERASVRIRTTQQILRSYLESYHPVDFSFWSANDLLGKTTIPLHRIVQPLQGTKTTFDILNKEFILRLHSPTLKLKENQQQEDQEEDQTMKPTVIVNVKLVREAVSANGNDEMTRATTGMGTMSAEQKRRQHNEQTNAASVIDDQTMNTVNLNKASDRRLSQKQIRDLSTQQRAQLLSVNNHALPSSINEDYHSNHVTNINDPPQPHPQTFNFPITATSTGSISHHFCLSIDLKSIRNVKTNHPLYLYCKYQYPFVGTFTPILTHPPISIERYQQDLQLPHSFCTFDFACIWQQLIDNFKYEPIQIDICVRDKGEPSRTNKDYLFGQVKLPLDKLLQQEKQRCSNANGIAGWRQTLSQLLTIINSANEKCGELFVIISLDDLGPLDLNSIAQQYRSQSVPPIPQQNNGLDNVFQRPAEDVHLQATYELQLWKETKELEFEKYLREIEAKKVYEIMEAFKEKDRDRESLLQKKMKEYVDLERQMKKAAIEVEKREKLLANNEQTIQRLQNDLKRDYDLKHIDMREASKRLQEQSDHQITLEKHKTLALEEEIISLKRTV
ncbi:unnamed protein product, partial [Didymodactylos carnosus]